MSYKDLVALLVWLTVMFVLMGVFTVAYERSKCNHIEIGSITHDLPLDIK